MNPDSDSFSFNVDQSDINIAKTLADLSGLSQTRIKHAMTCGAVWRNGKTRIRRTRVALKSGDKVTLYYNPQVLDAPTLECDLVDSDEGYSVWHKPRSMTISGSRFGDHTSLKRWVELNHESGNAYVVHRLDRFTEGLVLFAHNKKAAHWFSEQFRQRTVNKQYQAIVHGNFESARTVDLPIEGKSALSHITPIKSQGNRTLVNVTIESGRKHQIRRHLAGLGFPIVGDRLYGQDDNQDLQLLAYSLSFADLANEPVSVTLDTQHHLTLATSEHN